MARKPRRSARSSSRSGAPVVRFRMRVTRGEVVAIGPGKVELLETIERTGSITEAAKSLGMSYRRAWILLDTLNRSLRRPAVDSARGGDRGGGSALTDAGRELVGLYRHVERTAASACRRDIERLLEMLAR